MATPNNPHDKFFRASMQNKQVAQAFFQHYLPSDIQQALDLESLKLEANSYLDQGLREAFSDVVFTCEIQEREAKIALLIEHQSNPSQISSSHFGCITIFLVCLITH
jgi:predicted transposase/invertase (TIGR01784 family)